MQALSGLVVVSIEHAVAAPLCTARLSDAGARVIKIERAGGDFARRYDEAANGDSSYFAWINHGKESIVLDFKNADDSMLLSSMLSQADVLVQNLAPGALSRAGFDLDGLRTKHPRLVTCSISGYGNADAVKDMKAYDLLVQAESGLISISGGPGEPGRIGVSLCDIGAGVTAYTGILEALLRRSITGVGGHVDVSLFSVAAEWMSVPFLHADEGGQAPTRVGLKHPSIAPYGAFPDASDTLTLISVQNEREWQRLCTEALEKPELCDDPRYQSNDLRVANRDDLDRELAAVTAAMSTEQLREALQRASIAYGALNSVGDLLQHAALKRRQVQNSHGVMVSMPAHPVTHVVTDEQEQTKAPDLSKPVESVSGEFNSAKAELDGSGHARRVVPNVNQHGDALRKEFGVAND